MRRTSIESFQAITASGVLSRMRQRVYAFLYAHGPLTAHELDNRMAVVGEAAASYHKRLSELERMGLAEIIGERPCPITGMTASLWDTTDASAVIPVPVRPTKARAYRALLELVSTYLRGRSLSVEVATEIAARIDAKVSEIERSA